MISGTRMLTLLLLGLASTHASSQVASFDVDAAGTLKPKDASLQPNQPLMAKLPLAVAVTCADQGCKQVKVTVDGQPSVPGPVTDDSALFSITVLPRSPATVVVERSATARFQFQLSEPAAAKTAETSLQDEYLSCANAPRESELKAAHAHAQRLGEGVKPGKREFGGILEWMRKDTTPRVAVIIVTATGKVLQRPAHIDEGQVIVVSVYTSKKVISDLVVKRTSALRDANVIRVVGGDTAIGAFTEQSLRDAAAANCAFEPHVLGDDFAPGAGAFEIRSFSANGALSAVEFGVEPLYDGMFALGPMRTQAVDPEFYLSSDGTTQTIRQRNLGDYDVLYALSYTPFIWAKRNLQDPPPAFSIQRLNPTVGLVMNKVSDHYFVGVSYDLPFSGLVLTYGKHWRRVSRLDPDSGLAPGSVFAGTIEQLPVAREWRDEKFVALTLDLRVAAGFFQKATKAASN